MLSPRRRLKLEQLSNPLPSLQESESQIDEFSNRVKGLYHLELLEHFGLFKEIDLGFLVLSR